MERSNKVGEWKPLQGKSFRLAPRAQTLEVFGTSIPRDALEVALRTLGGELSKNAGILLENNAPEGDERVWTPRRLLEQIVPPSECVEVWLKNRGQYKRLLRAFAVLGGIPLTANTKLTGLQLSESFAVNNASEVDFSNATLQGVVFRCLSFRDKEPWMRPSFRSAHVQMQCEDLWLCAADFRECVMKKVTFVRCRFERVNFDGATLDNVTFIDCEFDESFSLQRAVTSSCVAEFVRYEEAPWDLSKRDFSGMLLRGKLSNAKLSGAKLLCTDPTIVLRGADLSGADLSGCDLTFADLRGVNLTDAMLDGVKIDFAWVSNARLATAKNAPQRLVVERPLTLRRVNKHSNTIERNYYRVRWIDAKLKVPNGVLNLRVFVRGDVELELTLDDGRSWSVSRTQEGNIADRLGVLSWALSSAELVSMGCAPGGDKAARAEMRHAAKCLVAAAFPPPVFVNASAQ